MPQNIQLGADDFEEIAQPTAPQALQLSPDDFEEVQAPQVEQPKQGFFDRMDQMNKDAHGFAGDFAGKTVNTMFLGLPEIAKNVGTAVSNTVGEKVKGFVKGEKTESAGQIFQRELLKADDREEYLKKKFDKDHFGLSMLATGLGYMEGAAGAIGKKFGKEVIKAGTEATAKQVGKSMVKTTLAVEGAKAAGDVATQAAGGRDVGDLALDETGRVAAEAAGALVFGVGGHLLVKGIGMSGKIGERMFAKYKDKLPPEAIKLIENFDVAKKFKGGANKLKQVWEETNAKITDEFRDVGAKLKAEIADDVVKMNPVVEASLNKLDDALIAKHDQYVNMMLGKQDMDLPKVLYETGQVFDGFKKNVQTNFGIYENELAKKVKTPVDISKSASNFIDDLKMGSETAVNEKGQVILPSAFNARESKVFNDTLVRAQKGTQKKYGPFQADLKETEALKAVPSYVAPKGKPGLSVENATDGSDMKIFVKRNADGDVEGMRSAFLPEKGQVGIRGTVDSFVAPNAQRKGVATEIADFAKKNGFDDLDQAIAEAPKTKAGAAFADKYLNRTGPMSFKEASELKRTIGKAIPWGNINTPEEKALVTFWKSLNDDLGLALGDNAGDYKMMNAAYGDILERVNKIENGAVLMRKASTVAEKGLTKESAAGYKSTMEAVVKGLDELQGAQLAGRATKLSQMPEQQVKVLKTTMDQARKAVVIADAVNYGGAQKQLAAMVKSKNHLDDKVLSQIKKMADTDKLAQEYEKLVNQIDAPQQILDALKDPMSPEAVLRAKNFINDYAGEAKPQLQALLQKAATYQRIMSSGKSNGHQMLKNLLDENLINPEDRFVMEHLMQYEPKLNKMLKDQDVLKGLIELAGESTDSTLNAVSRDAATGIYNPQAAAAKLLADGIKVLKGSAARRTNMILFFKKFEHKYNIPEKQAMKLLEYTEALARGYAATESNPELPEQDMQK